jgi:predicted SnoaL-like aldol condensation-catalyzing enzyme
MFRSCAWLGVGSALLALGCSSSGEDSSNDGGASQNTGGTVASGGQGTGSAAATGGSASGGGGTGGAVSSGGATASGGSAPGGGSGGGSSTGGSETGGTGTGGGIGSGCDPALAEANRTLVGQALDELFIDKDLTAIDRYWSDPYLQHNPIGTSGVTAFRNLMSSFVTSGSFSYTRLRTLAECDLVVVQGQYSGTGVIFDMFRVDDGKIIEHWDSDSNQASNTSGPTELSNPEATAANRTTVLAFFDSVLIGGGAAQIGDYVAQTFVEHRASGASGPDALLDYLAEEDIEYSEVHHTIADGNFVFTLSEGSRGGSAYGFYDLFRLEDGKLVEHWDSRRVVPNSTASGLGIF